jgi:hypothetical protein
MDSVVMAGLDPAIHVFFTGREEGVDARLKAGHGEFPMVRLRASLEPSEVT